MDWRNALTPLAPPRRPSAPPTGAAIMLIFLKLALLLNPPAPQSVPRTHLQAAPGYFLFPHSNARVGIAFVKATFRLEPSAPKVGDSLANICRYR